jgi:hypothetical protein
MLKRTVKLGTYDTAANGWTLAACQLSPAEEKTNFVDKPGGDGSWDLSTALTDGIPRYNDRTLTVVLESSEGDRQARETRIRQMVNQLDGMRLDIQLPDDPNHHLSGRLHVAREYNDLAHASVTVTAVCEPWKYANQETVVSLTASTTAKTAQLVNNGRRAVVPTIKASGKEKATGEAEVRLEYNSSSLSLSTGTYKWPELLLTPGTHTLKYSGTGVVEITYREAVLE